MDMNTIIVLGAALACAFSAYVLWKSKQDHVSFQVEAGKQATEFQAAVSGILSRHKSETVAATVAAVQAIQATPAAPATVAPAVEAPVAPYVPAGNLAAVQQMHDATVLINAITKESPVRDETTEGPKIAEWLSAHYPDMMSKVSRVIHVWATHAAFDYDDARAYVVENRDLSGQDLINAIGQQHRDDAAHVDGDLYNGPYPVGSLSQADMFYLLRIKPAYAERTGRNVIIDVVYGSAEKVNELIQDAGENHAPEMEAFNVDAYQGPLRPIVESRMNGR